MSRLLIKIILLNSLYLKRHMEENVQLNYIYVKIYNDINLLIMMKNRVQLKRAKHIKKVHLNKDHLRVKIIMTLWKARNKFLSIYHQLSAWKKASRIKKSYLNDIFIFTDPLIMLKACLKSSVIVIKL